MHPRSAPLLRFALFASLVLAAPGCKAKSHMASGSIVGAFRDPAGLLLRIGADDTVEWYLDEDGGSCIFLIEGTVDTKKHVLVAESGGEYPYALHGDTLTVSDPDDILEGDFTRVRYEDHCYVDVPPLDNQSASVMDLEYGAAVTVSGGAGREVSIDVPEGAVSFGIYLFGDPVGVRAAILALVSPEGVDVLDERNDPGFAEEDIEFCTLGHCNVVVPKETAIVPAPGTWTAVVGAAAEEDLDAIDLKGVVRTGPLPASTTFHVRPMLTTSIVDASAIEVVFESLAETFEGMYGITLEIDPVVVSSDPKFESLPQDFLAPTTAELMTMGDPQSLNVFLAERLYGVGGLLGISSGIPASHGVAGPFDGLLVHLANHLDMDGALKVELLEETLAHEMGHMLGLYHPTESDGTVFDPIDDTPECDAADFDVDMDGKVFADECAEAGGDDLMFWTPSTSTGDQVVQRTLTTDQVFVIERSLAGR
jgi:hypothetical protein